jgi:predicted SnoaL-like aldol condensation-catalyzing enzyme
VVRIRSQLDSFRLVEGRIAEDWEVLDEAEMMRQIRASPA